MKKLVALVFALSVIAGPSLSWGVGESGCSYSKEKATQDAKEEKADETDS